MTKIAIVGAGQMGSSIIKGFSANPEIELLVENPVNPRVDKLAENYNFALFHTIDNLLKENPAYIILTTPAKITADIVGQLNSASPETIIISAAAGIDYQTLISNAPKHLICRIIPNTPVAVSQGTIGIYFPNVFDEQLKSQVTNLLLMLGDVIPVKEDQLSIVGTIAGCGPAFVDVFLDALGDSGVLNGLSRPIANHLAASMVKGAASLAYESNSSPALLRDQVCSPGGTTIKGVVSLEKNGFRNAVIEAINKANQN